MLRNDAMHGGVGAIVCLGPPAIVDVQRAQHHEDVECGNPLQCSFEISSNSRGLERVCVYPLLTRAMMKVEATVCTYFY